MSKKSNKLKNKRRIKRRYILSAISITLLVTISLVTLLGLRDAFDDALPPPPGTVQADMLSISFYFRDEDGRWGSEQRQLEADEDKAALIEAVLEGLLEGPQTAAFLPSIPDGVYIEGARLRTRVENTLRVTFSPSFAYIDPLEMIFITSSMVYTLTDLDFIDQLEFYVGEEPMLDVHGEEFGMRRRENTSLAEDVPPIIVDSTVVMLYFPDYNSMGLIGESRIIYTNPQEDIERFILDALIEGPQTPGLYPAIPPTIAYNMLERLDPTDTIIVDLTQDFYDLLLAGGSTDEQMIVFSLVNTLTARPETRRVQIFIDGQPIQPDEDGSLHMDLSGPIERDEGIIVGHVGE